MSLATAGIYCTISPPLLRGNRRLFHSPSPIAANALITASQSMFGLLWNVHVVVAQEHRRQDSSHTMAKYQTATDKRASPVATLKSTRWLASRTGSHWSWRSTSDGTGRCDRFEIFVTFESNWIDTND